MRIEIRSETPADYNGISNVNYEAFLGWHPENPFVSEGMMVDFLRHHTQFDPELSLVAEREGEVVGHAIFAPYRFVVLGVEQRGVVLGPIAVKPGLQGKGIGGRLITEGHARAREKGFSFSLLCGHPEYYPRFGYKTCMFSLIGTRVHVDKERKAQGRVGLGARPVMTGDIPWLLEAWKTQHGSSSLALFPGETISDWMNCGLECRCMVVLQGDRVLGYIRYARSNPLTVKDLLPRQGEDILKILVYLTQKEPERTQSGICIARRVEELQPYLKGNFKHTPEEEAHKAFMIKVLEPDSLMAEYCDRVDKGKIKPGIIVFPSSYDAEEGRRD